MIAYHLFVLNRIAFAIRKQLSMIFWRSSSCCALPSLWKTAYITPLVKRRPTNDIHKPHLQGIWALSQRRYPITPPSPRPYKPGAERFSSRASNRVIAFTLQVTRITRLHLVVCHNKLRCSNLRNTPLGICQSWLELSLEIAPSWSKKWVQRHQSCCHKRCTKRGTPGPLLLQMSTLMIFL